jgi:hypothetical protein
VSRAANAGRWVVTWRRVGDADHLRAKTFGTHSAAVGFARDMRSGWCWYQVDYLAW